MMNLDEKDESNSMESPCIRNCCLDNNDICLGCFRSLTEITEWALVNEEKKQLFLKIARERKEQMRASTALDQYRQTTSSKY